MWVLRGEPPDSRNMKSRSPGTAASLACMREEIRNVWQKDVERPGEWKQRRTEPQV